MYMATKKQIKYWKSLKGHNRGFQKGHKFIKGGEKGWFKKGRPNPRKGTAKLNFGICLNCGIGFKWKPRKSGAKFCSRKCMGEHYKKVKQQPPLIKMFGEDNPQWKNGVSTINKLLRGSSEFKKWRKEVFEYDNYTCWICELGGRIHPHHLKSFSKYPELRFVKSNGLTLCEYCHRTYTKFGVKQ